MLFHFFTSLIDQYSFFNVFKYLTFRTGLSVITSLVIVFIIGSPLIKIFSEKICQMYKNKMNILIIRPGNIFGPNDKFDLVRSKVVPSLIRKFETKKNIEIWGDGKDIKDFIYIDDFVTRWE